MNDKLEICFNKREEYEKKYFYDYYEYLVKLKNLSKRYYLYFTDDDYLDIRKDITSFYKPYLYKKGKEKFRINKIKIEKAICCLCNTKRKSLYIQGTIKMNNKEYEYQGYMKTHEFWHCRCDFKNDIPGDIKGNLKKNPIIFIEFHIYTDKGYIYETNSTNNIYYC